MPEVSAALRAFVRERAQGRCEYCRLEEASAFLEHEVDHVIALKHGGTSDPDNLAFCCALCNRYKGSDIASIDPETGLLQALFHPRRHHWVEHFGLDSGRVVGLTPEGRATARLLQLNRFERLRERVES